MSVCGALLLGWQLVGTGVTDSHARKRRRPDHNQLPSLSGVEILLVAFFNMRFARYFLFQGHTLNLDIYSTIQELQSTFRDQGRFEISEITSRYPFSSETTFWYSCFSVRYFDAFFLKIGHFSAKITIDTFYFIQPKLDSKVTIFLSLTYYRDNFIQSLYIYKNFHLTSYVFFFFFVRMGQRP